MRGHSLAAALFCRSLNLRVALLPAHCTARFEQKGDLARMYRLFNRLPRGLEPMADIFRRHVEDEGGSSGAWGPWLGAQQERLLARSRR